MTLSTRRKYAGDTAYSRCKGFGHRWDDYADPNLRPPAQGFARIAFRCTECKRCKYYDMNLRTGQIGTPRYYNLPEDWHNVTMSTRSEWKISYYQELYKATNNGRRASA